MATDLLTQLIEDRPLATDVQSNWTECQSNWAFLEALTTVIGDFDPAELAPHRVGLLALLNDAIAHQPPHAGVGSGLVAFGADTPVVVIQRAFSRLTR